MLCYAADRYITFYLTGRKYHPHMLFLIILGQNWNIFLVLLHNMKKNHDNPRGSYKIDVEVTLEETAGDVEDGSSAGQALSSCSKLSATVVLILCC